MRWDMNLFTGVYDHWHWAVSRHEIEDLSQLVCKSFPEKHLCILTFDSGPILPGSEERAIGWSNVGEVMVSPPIHSALDVPTAGYDEWCVFDHVPSSFLENEHFVNYSGFNLADPRAMADSFDPTWDRSSLDWLVPIQERFWEQVKRLDPVAYILSGDHDIVVSKKREFLDQFVRAVRQISPRDEA